ncbi:MAG TPA: TRAP transporter permease [Trueperaceae bacterium]
MTTEKLPNYSRIATVLIALTGILLSLFQLYTAGIRPLSLFYQRPIHLMLIMILTFLMFPLGKERRLVGWLVDLLFIGGSLLTGLYITLNLDAIIMRAGFWTTTDIIIGGVLIVTLLEAGRRAIGLVMPLIGLVFILYSMAGPRGALPFLGDFLPGILGHRGYSLDRIIAQLYLGQEGIYGIALGVAATFVYIFILFGAVLEVTGAGQFFIDLAYALTGRQRGGPAKAAVVSSGFMGSISGSAIANTVTTGAFTIPLMKRLGYKPEEAGGVEAAASTGGQIMPPIMGAGAFLIAEFTRTPYVDIVMISFIPAILYFSVVYLFVDIIAAKRGMMGIPADQLPKAGTVMRQGWHYLIPLVVLVYFLFRNISPERVGFIAVLAILGVAVLRWLVGRLLMRSSEPATTESWEVSRGARSAEAPASTPRGLLALGVHGLGQLLSALEAGARNSVPVSLACATAGIVVGIVGLTGLGLKFSSLMISFSQGNLLLALILIIIASLVLGMGLPVTASYIVLVILVAPALTQDFGVPLLIAHLVVFWYSQDSNVTPPVALAAYAGAGIAGADPMRTAMQAWKFAKGLYLIPLFMVYNQELVLWEGVPFVVIAWTVLTSFAALWAFAATLEGYLFTRMYLVSRLLAAAGTVGIFWPDLRVEIAGFTLILLVLAINWFKNRREQREDGGRGIENSFETAEAAE